MFIVQMRRIKRRYHAWRSRARKFRKKSHYWRVSYTQQIARCESLHDKYMTALDEMTDNARADFHFVPRALLERDMDDDLWMQHIENGPRGTWSYMFEI